MLLCYRKILNNIFFYYSLITKMSNVIKFVSKCSKCQNITVRGISSSNQYRDKSKKDEFDVSKFFKDVKPADIGSRQEYQEKVQFENPFLRTSRIVKNDMKYLGHKIKRFMGLDSELSHDVTTQFFPTHTDILIIGGGIVGSSIAYWLKQRAPHAMEVVIAEKGNNYDLNYSLSRGGLYQQFSLPENVLMAQYGAEFYQNIGKHLSIAKTTVPDIQFTPHGNLFLANEKDASKLKENADMQNKIGARNVLLSASKLKEQFPWMNTDDVELGCLGYQNEGWMNPISILNAFKSKSINLGAEFVQAEVVDFETCIDPDTIAATPDGKYEKIERAIVKLPNGEILAIKFAFCIIAAGVNSGIVSQLAKIGVGEGLMSVPLPIEPRPRSIYCYNSPKGPGLDTPLVVDPSGVYFRRNGFGGSYVAGFVPDFKKETSSEKINNIFEEKLLPILAKRVPGFEKSKLENTVDYLDEYNTMDENGIIGQHPLCNNILFATGFGGNGIQHAPAIGRGIMELLLDGHYKTINLSRLGFDRLCLGEPLNEQQCVL